MLDGTAQSALLSAAQDRGPVVDTTQLLKGVLDLAVLAVVGGPRDRACVACRLPTAERDLLEDLPGHLAETLAETGGLA